MVSAYLSYFTPYFPMRVVSHMRYTYRALDLRSLSHIIRGDKTSAEALLSVDWSGRSLNLNWVLIAYQHETTQYEIRIRLVINNPILIYDIVSFVWLTFCRFTIRSFLFSKNHLNCNICSPFPIVVAPLVV